MTEQTIPNEGHGIEQLEASQETALGALERAGAQGLGLIDAWVRRGNAAAVSEVAERGSGAARKAARRGLNVLRARGVPIPQTPHVATLSSTKPEETLEAWLLAPDATGSIMLVIAAHTPSSRYRAVLAYLNDVIGVQRADYVEVAWSQLKETMSRTAASSGVKPVKVPVEWARARIGAARSRNRESRLLEPLGMDRGQGLLEPLPDKPPSHPLDEEGLELTIEDARELAKASAALHRLPEFRGWMPMREAVDQMMAEVGKHLSPGQQPEREVVEELLRKELDAAADRYFSPQSREQLARAMKDSALSVLEREGEQTALEVVAAIKCIEQAGLITDPPHEVPFLRAFFEKAVAVLAAQGQGNIRIPVPAQASPGGEGEPSSPGAEEPAAQPEEAAAAQPEEPAAAPADEAQGGEAPG
jgi:hypothetical protein